jgi:serine/threonine protein kinase
VPVSVETTPDKFSQFTIYHKLGSGSFGEVYLVKDRDTLTEYALKSMQKHTVVR